MDRKTSNYRRTGALITTCLILAILFIPASALKVEGARIALDVEPGRTYTSPITISLGPDETGGTYAIDVLGFGQSRADGSYTGLDASEDTSPCSARPFIIIDRPTVSLQPGERAEVNALIDIPADTRDGGRYALILVHPAGASSGAPAAFATAVAIPVLLTVKNGAITESCDIQEIAPAGTEPGRPFGVSLTVLNSGNYHVYGIVSNVSITDTGGRIIVSGKTDPMVRALIPGQAVDFKNDIKVGLPAGMYRIVARIEKQDGKLLAEKRADLIVGSGNPGSTTLPTAPAGGTKPGLFLPGFGALAGVAGLAVSFMAGFSRWRKCHER